ncbi:hypothetical protein MTX20_00370 (plasmid) [Bradyrhizobium sp. ISRA435]|nr:hypothetical protein MTX20_00370 [Bradyrhizobium sp. ISRA435]
MLAVIITGIAGVRTEDRLCDGGSSADKLDLPVKSQAQVLLQRGTTCMGLFPGDIGGHDPSLKADADSSAVCWLR